MMNVLRSAGESTLSATFYVAEAVAVILCAMLMACVVLISFVVREFARGAERRRTRTPSRTRPATVSLRSAH